MTNPPRLLDGAASESELRLLHAAASEEPPAEALSRLAARLGVRAPPAPTASAVSATSAPAPWLWSVIGAGIAAAGLAVTATWYATRPAEHDRPSPSPPPAAAPAQPPAQLETPAPPSAASPEPASARALAEEIERLDAVRRLLASRRPRPALAALRTYERDYPEGALRQEAALLQIEALRRAGDRAQARALAERVLADNPDSPHAPRVRALAFGGTDAR